MIRAKIMVRHQIILVLIQIIIAMMDIIFIHIIIS